MEKAHDLQAYRFIALGVLLAFLLSFTACSGDGSDDSSSQSGRQKITSSSQGTSAPQTEPGDSSNTEQPASGSAVIIDHTSTRIDGIPREWIEKAKSTLHIAYGHTSHGSQITTGMTGLVDFKGSLYSYRSGGAGDALDLRDSPFQGAYDLGNPDRTAWSASTRSYLNNHPEVNVVVWSWCGQVNGTPAEIDLYLSGMNSLEKEYPGVKFVYMTGHLDGTGLEGNVHLRNEQIRSYCRKNGKILYDFADIESYNPDGLYFGDRIPDDACDYDSNRDGVRDANWALTWQASHIEGTDWYSCSAAHSQPLNANLKAYAAWWMWARLAGWSG
jgi:hypothetical protein